ncbi:hypothetical protein IM538_13610 [Cytobacillus suaedae]|nr:hypothetical protein IM538_13610 [Cytobacillus suaedae]
MMNKWLVIIGVILLSLSQQRYRLNDFIHEIITRNINLTENYLISIPLLFFMEIIGGFLHILGTLLQFALSWEGVLLIAVILLHLNIRAYMKRS